jgi:hypothetical protein
MVLVAFALLALIGSAALILLAGSAEWQKNQLQELADSTALDSALTIGTSCSAAKASAVITEADNFLATRRTRTGSLVITAGTCATPYQGQDTFAGGLTSTINYPYRANQQRVEVILSLALPISFGAEVGSTTTTVVRRAVAQQLAESAPAVSATTLTCAGGQVNVAGGVVTQNLIVRTGTCSLYAHARFDAASGTHSDLGNVSVYTDGQTWVTAAGTCVAGSNSGSTKTTCADGYELTGHLAPTCGAVATSFLSAGDAAINPNPCAAGKAPQAVPPLATTLSPEPNLDASAVATLMGTGGAACVAATVYAAIKIGATTIGTGLGPVPIKDASNYYHIKPSCYGYLDISQIPGGLAVLDPGFYYFNGSGFAGGGGICLNGKTLLARDVTIEFVNTAGFSSNTCAANSGGSCANPCQFGSNPANAAVDPPSNLTWFASPCTVAPNPPDASCPGSAWCPAGDRSCSNQLIWAPASSTGQINLKGNNSKAWLLGTITWPGTCTIQVNGTGTIAGDIACGALSLRAAAGAGIAVGSDSGINTALVEAVLIE